jgi:hypothetical protein
MRNVLIVAVFVFVVLLAIPLVGEFDAYSSAPSSCEFEYEHAKSVPVPNTWIYRSNTGDYPQPYNYHAPGFEPKLIDNVLDVRPIVPR